MVLRMEVGNEYSQPFAHVYHAWNKADVSNFDPAVFFGFCVACRPV